MREEVGVDKNRVRRGEGGIVLKEKGGRDLGDFADDFIAFSFFLSFELAFVLVLFSRFLLVGRLKSFAAGPCVRTVESHVAQLFV